MRENDSLGHRLFPMEEQRSPSAADWIEIAKLVREARHATDEATELVDLYGAGRLSLEALKEGLRALARRH